ncbi:hypothetical protein PG995_010538 [Apiospora arundinis]
MQWLFLGSRSNSNGDSAEKMPDYKGLASLMNDHHDVSIFRRFRNLNIQNLLHMQAELIHLEQELQEIYDEDRHSDDQARQSYRFSWKAMEDKYLSGGDAYQRNKLLECREKLEKYNTSLLLQAQLNGLCSPKRENLEFLREWLKRPGHGNNFLQSFERRTWEEVEPDDTVVLQREDEDQGDLLTRWLLRVIPGIFHHLWGHRWKTAVHDPEKGYDGLFVYKDSNFARFTTVVTTILSAVFPVASILVLYYVEAMPVRLWLILAFTSLFALALLLMSKSPPGRDIHGYFSVRGCASFVLV